MKSMFLRVTWLCAARLCRVWICITLNFQHPKGVRLKWKAIGHQAQPSNTLRFLRADRRKLQGKNNNRDFGNPPRTRPQIGMESWTGGRPIKLLHTSLPAAQQSTAGGLGFTLNLHVQIQRYTHRALARNMGFFLKKNNLNDCITVKCFVKWITNIFWNHKKWLNNKWNCK